MKYSREQLKEMGFEENQIDAMMAVEKDEKVVPIQVSTKVPESKDLTVTTLADLQSYNKGTVVRFPDFAEGQPFIARVRRPSLLVLAKQGKIPNSLLKSAGELFTKGGSGMKTDENTLSDVYGVCEVIAKATLIEPTYEDIQSVGLSLSDDQIMAIFNYAQNGVRALESFR